MFRFAPVPGVRRVIFLATPHDGANAIGRLPARVVRNLIRQPEEVERLAARLRRDNPAAFTSLDALPLSWFDLMVDADAHLYLDAIRGLPGAPDVSRHTILGTAHRGVHGPKGDYIVPVESASIPGAASELRLDAGHLTVVPDPRTAAEVGRILERY
jgi:hypothetical protein